MEDPNARGPKHLPPVGLQFIWEVIVFLTGLFVGFFWFWYQNVAAGKPETHIIIGLLVIIIILSRYVFLLWQRQK